ncbi:hypothetical protein L0F63_003742 [Massospora cicadina]|nr:hypothetical protein L0F63_003742 [Massospora cicadina]
METAVYDNSRFDSNHGKPHVVVSKTFHRYTVRRKQGGSQSGNDNSKSKARSAGANIRRQMEAMLREEIHALLAEWVDLLANCRQLYVRAPGANHKILYPNVAFTPHNQRICNFPFTTRRPTLKEAQRCYLELIHPKSANLEIRPISPRPSLKIKSDAITPRTNPTPQKPKPRRVQRLHREEPDLVLHTNAEPEPLTLDLIDALVTWIQNPNTDWESNSLPELITKIQNSQFLQTMPNYRIKGLPNHPTLLHLASQHGQAKLIIPLLKLGCSPTLPLIEASNPKTAYQLAKSKPTKLQFRIYRFHHPDQYDWELANVPTPISPEAYTTKLTSQKLKRKLRSKKKTNLPSDLPPNAKASIGPPKADPLPSIFSAVASLNPKSVKPISSGFGSFSTSGSSKLGFGFTMALTNDKASHQ